MATGRLIRDLARVMARPFVPRTLGEEEQAGFAVASDLREKLSQDAIDAMSAQFAEEQTSADPITAARARGFVRGFGRTGAAS